MKSSCSAAPTVRPIDDQRGLNLTGLVYVLALLWLVCSRAYAQPALEIRFDIRTGALADALDRFSEQAGLQIVYDPVWIADRNAPAVSGTMTATKALDQLLRGLDLDWQFLNERTIAINRHPVTRTLPVGAYAPEEDGHISPAVVVLQKYVKDHEPDRSGLLTLEPIDSVLGIRRALFDTPRSATAMSDDLLNSYGVESALDLSKAMPGTYTASIFGINGNVNIRGVTSDTYFRGIKRLENTQLFPSPITAMSRLVVVRGPPSPLFGPGKVGGYTDFIPKSARAATGKYLDAPTGEVRLTGGSYDKRALAAEIGGPFAARGRHGGYYVYASAERADSYYDNVPFEQHILQSSFDFEISPAVRLEFGQMFQLWKGTELAGWNRITQELIDSGIYRSGEPLVDMDLDGDGLISTAEVDSFGPLMRTFSLHASPERVADALPENWRIDPTTSRPVQLSRSATAQSAEDDGRAEVNLAYLDCIVSMNDGSSFTNKMYFEHLDRYKWTRASAFGQETQSTVFENKLLYQRSDTAWSGRLAVNFGASASYRYYDTTNLTGAKYNDLVNRADISQPFSTRNRFAVPNLEPDLAPWNTGLDSTYTNSGFGALLDASYGKTTVMAGVRYDWLDIHSHIPEFVLTTPGADARGHDRGLSWSLSLSREVFRGIRPYATYAEQQTLVYGIDGGIGITVVPDAMNIAELREVGLKALLFDDSLFATVAAYRQTRKDFHADTTQVPATFSRGWEAELRWLAHEKVSLSAGATWQKTRYVPLRSAIIMVGTSTFGLGDDYFGGRLQALLPASEAYDRRSGYPDLTLNLNGSYSLTRTTSLNLSLSYQDEVSSGRLRDITLPSALVSGAALIYQDRRYLFRLSINNLTNELYFTPNSPDVTGQVIVIPAPERNVVSSFSFLF